MGVCTNNCQLIGVNTSYIWCKSILIIYGGIEWESKNKTKYKHINKCNCQQVGANTSCM